VTCSEFTEISAKIYLRGQVSFTLPKLGSSDLPASVSQVVGIKDALYISWLCMFSKICFEINNKDILLM
jgi:hypothetical protein